VLPNGLKKMPEMIPKRCKINPTPKTPKRERERGERDRERDRERERGERWRERQRERERGRERGERERERESLLIMHALGANPVSASSISDSTLVIQ